MITKRLRHISGTAMQLSPSGTESRIKHIFASEEFPSIHRRIVFSHGALSEKGLPQPAMLGGRVIATPIAAPAWTTTASCVARWTTWRGCQVHQSAQCTLLRNLLLLANGYQLELSRVGRACMFMTDAQCLQLQRQRLPCNLTVSQRRSCRHHSPLAQRRLAAASHCPTLQPSTSYIYRCI